LPLDAIGCLKRSPGKRLQTGASRLGSLCGGGDPPRCERITTSPPTVCFGHHCAMQNTRSKKRSPERGLISRGHTGSSLAGVQLEHYPSRTLPGTIGITGDNSRILFGCDIDVTSRWPMARMAASSPAESLSFAEKGADIVTPKKGRPLNLGLIGRQKRFSRACREGIPARKRPHLRLDGGHYRCAM